jgi:MerR family transcriptional regulator, redox-sensitive transcriptional activator SoxR
VSSSLGRFCGVTGLGGTIQLQVDLKAREISVKSCRQIDTASAREFYNIPMTQLTISELARQAGLRPSAIRYYEQIKILPPPPRISGQRRYDTTALHRLAVIQRAQQSGFTLNEIRQLFFGFRKSTPAFTRWQRLSHRKIVELDRLMNQVKSMQELLGEMVACCRCETLDQCGRGIHRQGGVDVPLEALILKSPRHSLKILKV